MFRIKLFVLAIVLPCIVAVDIKKYLKICDRNAPEINECLKDAIQDALKATAGGIKELGLPSVDPYHQKELRVEYKRNQILIKMTMKDVYVYGNKDSKIKDVRLRADEDTFHLEVDLVTPHVFIKADYHADGSYNSLKINTHGVLNTTMTDLVYTWKLDGIPEKKENGTFLKIESFYMRPDVGNLKSYIGTENPDFVELVRLGNDFANSNWKALYRELLPIAQANWNKIGVRLSNKIFQKVPYDEIFPVNS